MNITAFLTASAINGEKATIATATTVNAQSNMETQATQTKWHIHTATTAIATHKETQTTQAKKRTQTQATTIDTQCTAVAANSVSPQQRSVVIADCI